MIYTKEQLVHITTKQIKQELFDYLCQNEIDHLRESLSKHYRAKEINLIFKNNELSCFLFNNRQTQYQSGVNNVIVYGITNITNKNEINKATITNMLHKFVARLSNYELLYINNQFSSFITKENKELHYHIELWVLSNFAKFEDHELAAIHSFDTDTELVATYLCNLTQEDWQKITASKVLLLFQTKCLELPDNTLTATLMQKLANRFFSKESKLDFDDYEGYTLLSHYLRLLSKLSFPIHNITLPIAQASDWLNYDLQNKQHVLFVLENKAVTVLKEIPICMPNESDSLALTIISQLCANHKTSFASKDFKHLTEKQLLDNDDKSCFRQIATLINDNLT